MHHSRFWKASIVMLLAYICRSFHIRNALKCQHLCIGMASDGYSQGNSYNRPQEPRSEIPSRFDTCLLIVTGIIGVDPKETYLKNGHYVLNFPVAIVGHFGAAHEWERFKPTETMWLPSEVWDDLAKGHLSVLRKGSKVRTVGTLLSNKWTDKTTGEERKQFKYRITKLLSEEELKDLSNILEINFDLASPSAASSLTSSNSQISDSNFQSDFPAMDSQVDSGYYYADQAAVIASPTSINYNGAAASPIRAWNSRNNNNNAMSMNTNNKNNISSANRYNPSSPPVAAVPAVTLIKDENPSWLTEDPDTEDFWFDR